MPSPTPLRRRALAFAAIFAAAALTLSACSSEPAPAPAAAGTQGGVYKLGIESPDGTINPTTTADYNAMLIAGLANAQLVTQDLDGKLRPQLAESWEPSSDGITWTFHLRKGEKFSDGTPLTAADAVASFQALIAEDSLSPAKGTFTGILASVAQGKDDTSIEFTLARPYSDFPYLLTGANTFVLPKGSDPEQWLQKPVGAGQFILNKYTPGQGVTFEKNPNYWDAEHVDLAGVDVKFYSDEQSQLLAFQRGELDQIGGTAAAIAALDAASYRATTSGYYKIDAFAFNVTKAPFDDVKVRQAVAWALDRNQIVETAYNGFAAPGNDLPYFPGFPGQPQGVQQRQQNAEKVKELLGGRTVEFTITTYEGEKALAELIQQQLNGIGGFKVDLDILTSAQYYADGDGTPWLNAPATITNWAKRLPSQYINALYSSTSSWNASHYDNPEVQKLSTEFDAATDNAARQAATDKIAASLWNDVPVIIATFQSGNRLLSTRVHGDFQASQNFDGGYDFRGVWIKAE